MPALLVNQNGQSGPVIIVKGSGDFQLSDSVSFAGVESVNPHTKKPTGLPLIVCCMGYDQERGTMQISPCLITEGPYQNATCLPADSALITNHSRRADA